VQAIAHEEVQPETSEDIFLPDDCAHQVPGAAELQCGEHPVPGVHREVGADGEAEVFCCRRARYRRPIPR